jgi:hypothetical protein
MNIGALTQAMKEKEMINLITNLMKYREAHGKEMFLEVISQMNEVLALNKQTLSLSDEDIREALKKESE